KVEWSSSGKGVVVSCGVGKRGLSQCWTSQVISEPPGPPQRRPVRNQRRWRPPSVLSGPDTFILLTPQAPRHRRSWPTRPMRPGTEPGGKGSERQASSIRCSGGSIDCSRANCPVAIVCPPDVKPQSGPLVPNATLTSRPTREDTPKSAGRQSWPVWCSDWILMKALMCEDGG